MDFYERLSADLDGLRLRGCLRALPVVPEGVVNVSSNDYLGLLGDGALREAFYAEVSGEDRLLSAASSRLLTGNCAAVRGFEEDLATAYGAEAALVFGSGYHANTGILPAIAGPKTLVLSDKLNHASMIDGVRASGCKCYRYRHNDLAHARSYLEKFAEAFDEVIVMTESVFSMDGDRTDLAALVQLKRDFPNVLLYLDEAHGVGVFGETGLGCAHAAGVHREIDFLVGTLGKAWCSMGAFVICRGVVRETLVNRVRPFIFTTGLPPVNVAWSRFILRALPGMGERRARVVSMGARLAEAIRGRGVDCVSGSQIVPFVVGSNEAAMRAAGRFREAGFYVLPIRPPTVPEGSARLRFSLSAGLSDGDFERLLSLVAEI